MMCSKQAFEAHVSPAACYVSFVYIFSHLDDIWLIYLVISSKFIYSLEQLMIDKDIKKKDETNIWRKSKQKQNWGRNSPLILFGRVTKKFIFTVIQYFNA